MCESDLQNTLKPVSLGWRQWRVKRPLCITPFVQVDLPGTVDVRAEDFDCDPSALQKVLTSLVEYKGKRHGELSGLSLKDIRAKAKSELVAIKSSCRKKEDTINFLVGEFCP